MYDEHFESFRASFRSSEEKLIWLAARTQDSGRGRAHHRWESFEGNMHLSFLAFDVPKETMTWAPLAIACALHQTVSQFTKPNQLKIKWPNDLYLDSKKCAGILCESLASDGPDVRDILIGVGINLHQAPSAGEISRHTRHAQSIETNPMLPIPTAIFKEAPSPWTLERWIQETLIASNLWLGRLRSSHVSTIREYFENHSFFLGGESLQWCDSQSQQQCRGRYLKLGDYGELCVELSPCRTLVRLFSETVQKLSVHD
jgi:biotin-(acetyl-CoA carboxylase) ligase